jgi:hypothetical protein
MTPTLSDVIAECERASEGSRELDAEIALAIGAAPPESFRPSAAMDAGTFAIGAYGFWKAAEFTRSLDAAMTLVPNNVKRLYLEIDNGPGEGHAAHASIVPSAVDCAISFGHANTLSLALCIAALRARAILAKGEMR